MLSLRTFVTLLLLLGVAVADSTAQAGSRREPLVDVGLGIGTASHGLGGVLYLGVGTTIGDFLVRGAGGAEFNIVRSSESTSDIALLYGRTARRRAGFVRVAAGVGAVESLRRGTTKECALFVCRYDMIKDNSVGLALQLDAVWAFSSPFGLGVGAFANANSSRSFGGAVVSLHFGRIR